MIKILYENENTKTFNILNIHGHPMLLGVLYKTNNEIKCLFDSNMNLLVESAIISVKYKSYRPISFYIKQIKDDCIITDNNTIIRYDDNIENIQLIRLELEDGYYEMDNSRGELIWN